MAFWSTSSTTGWPVWRNRNLLTPLWHFHRVLAGREDPLNTSPTSYAIEVDWVDLFETKNAESSSTSKYELVLKRKACVVRRGETFRIGIGFKGKRKFDSERDNIRLVFEFGTNPSFSKGTKAIIPVTVTNKVDGADSAYLDRTWCAYIVKIFEDQLEICIQSPVDSLVGLWQLKAETSYKHQLQNRNSFASKVPVYILFNPFHKDDPVFLAHTPALDEYVFNEVGTIYGGTHNRVKGRPWVFGQFRDSVLPAVCHALQMHSNIRDSEMGDPIKVARVISAVVNSLDDKGILQGRWDGKYDDGTQPFAWTGSVAILEQFLETGSPVKYGQCWVFAGLVTTICRCLGIPCRPITNYVSAHDTNSSLSVDKFYDEHGVEATEGGEFDSTPAGRGDSIWNFHVWNEVWMTRPDLPDMYGGWQVIDATPQEESEDLYQCGPAPVEAVRRGELGLSFDVGFVFTEVNADVFAYMVDELSPWGYKLVETNTDHVGRLLVTKSLKHSGSGDNDDYETVTDSYKHKEGSLVERLTVLSAMRKTTFNWRYKLMAKEEMKDSDVEFSIINLDKGTYGESYSVTLVINNHSSHVRTVRILMSSTSTYYNGVKAFLIKRGEGEFRLGPREKDTLTMVIDPPDYMPKTVEYCQFYNQFLANVTETKQIWSGEDTFYLDKPNLAIRVTPNPARISKPCKIVIEYDNPLDQELSNCSLALEGPGVVAPMKSKFANVGPKATASFQVEAYPWRSGSTTLVANFNCEELYNITGTKQFMVLG